MSPTSVSPITSKFCSVARFIFFASKIRNAKFFKLVKIFTIMKREWNCFRKNHQNRSEKNYQNFTIIFKFFIVNSSLGLKKGKTTIIYSCNFFILKPKHYQISSRVVSNSSLIAQKFEHLTKPASIN